VGAGVIDGAAGADGVGAGLEPVRADAGGEAGPFALMHPTGPLASARIAAIVTTTAPRAAKLSSVSRLRSAQGWVALACLVAAPRVASAWTCGTEPPGFVLPPPHVPAPRNVRPIVRLPIGDEDAPCLGSPCANDVAALELRTAPHPTRAPRVIPVEVSERRAGDVATFVLTPFGPLEARRRYEIVAVVRSFATSDAFDRTAPTWGGPSSIRLVPFAPPASPGAKRRTVVLTMGPHALRTFAELWGPAASDAGMPPDLVTYAVRVADSRGVVDRASVPRGFFIGQTEIAPRGKYGILFWLGQVDSCFAHTFDFPKTGTLRIGVTAVDLAGNESPMFEHTLELAPP
jgi:hypothetical protein